MTYSEWVSGESDELLIAIPRGFAVTFVALFIVAIICCACLFTAMDRHNAALCQDNLQLVRENRELRQSRTAGPEKPSSKVERGTGLFENNGIKGI
jgi:hypothetical protein